MSLFKNKHHTYEPIWHVQIGLLTTIMIQIVLPNHLSAFPKFLIPSLLVACMIALQVFTPKKPIFSSRVRRLVVLIIILAIAAANATSLQLLLEAMIHAKSSQAPELLLSAAGIYLTNLIVFALLYWEIDDGGPGLRRQADNTNRDFLFPQQNLSYSLKHAWYPTFIDYLYVSITNGTAFSPTDTLPLTRRAKLLMGFQAILSLIIVVLITARAINIL